MGGVRAGPKHGGEISASRGPQRHQHAAIDIFRVGYVGNFDALSVLQDDAVYIHGVAKRMLADLARRVAVSCSALVAWTGGQRFELGAAQSRNDGRRDIGYPNAEPTGEFTVEKG